ncbi:GNAT family N-acetyltransferase [Chromobacterium violaceum]|uniref:BioF2-like acetyltransferase domain-containing protein n=1 Tax=Chromobacterium violaceum (strain ATCC 12472 / DSM 30191 / JCM 1249 / CCUG 213 / NBRC 12614 / NCIMB 9131 / NCTC 9757 / MK) TaxID=243365 RepID=Q7NPQ8_CHRVO|nr:GNAT family N-acetyltransferase [Chromobacterium violaceum]AAQ64068.1 conserved hypothetical protein [Chromobacterium violaceum ATCC 12472]SUX89133.1 Uncharacterized protein involved in methicillin resistance [Chromobacterium violaceum]
MMKLLSFDEACQWFDSLPAHKRIATLSPYYVLLDALRDTRLLATYIGFRQGDVFWMHSVHCSAAMAGEVIDLQSPYGYGGPISNCDDPVFLNMVWDLYVEFCARQGWLAEFVRFHPLGGVSSSYGGTIVVDRLTVAIDLTGPNIRSIYSTRCRTAVRKAINNGLNVRVGSERELREIFPHFYRDGMRAIAADKFYLFNDLYFSGFSTWKCATLLICHCDDDWLSAGIFLKDGNVMEYHLSATTPAGRNLGATNLLLDAAAHLGQEQGCSFLYLGGGTDSEKNNPLLFFKSGFSAATYPFLIGFTAFNQDKYQALREKFISDHKPTDRFLFYR